MLEIIEDDKKIGQMIYGCAMFHHNDCRCNQIAHAMAMARAEGFAQGRKEGRKSVYQDKVLFHDLTTKLMEAMGIQTHARSYSAAEVFEKEVLPLAQKAGRILEATR